MTGTAKRCRRVLIVPAAGLGTRLDPATPKLLYPVEGRPMLEHLLDMYSDFVDRFIVVVSPAAKARVAGVIGNGDRRIDWVEQAKPTGMLDAILAAQNPVRRQRPRYVWITWCDQIAVTGRTIRGLALRTGPAALDAMVFPTLRQRPPYVHWVRDARGRITDVRQRREGDPMPDEGETDIGLFALRSDTYLEALPEFAASARRGPRTRERNFLPFVPWLSRRERISTFKAVDPIEAIGINTPADLRLVEDHLRARAAPRS